MDYLDTLSRFAAELDYASLPPAVREQTSWVLADTLASIVGGSAEPELRALAGRLGTPGPATHGATRLPGWKKRKCSSLVTWLNTKQVCTQVTPNFKNGLPPWKLCAP